MQRPCSAAARVLPRPSLPTLQVARPLIHIPKTLLLSKYGVLTFVGGGRNRNIHRRKTRNRVVPVFRIFLFTVS
jgi:hypothetical protein